MPFGAEITSEGVRFALWAPSARSVDLVRGDDWLPMPNAGQGWYRLVDASASVGDRYGFAIDGGTDLVPDPTSRFQEDDVDRRTSVEDPEAYEWSDAAWVGRPWDETILYEVHLGTATPEGTYSAFEDKLDGLKDLGITAIELMPLAETSGLRTWGYDGVLPFAPNNCYGRPADLKRLVDKAHGLGLMFFLDVVYNHFGPSGNFLHRYAKSFFNERHQTPWGAAINFDGDDEAADVVREFFVQNALYWLKEFHIDGLRLDAVHAIVDNSDRHFLDELAERVRDGCPNRHVHLVLENEGNEAHRLIRDGDVARSFDAQWNDDYHHCWHVLLTGEDEGYYSDFGGDTVSHLARCMAEGFVYQGEYSKNLKRNRGEPSRDLPPSAFVSFLQNHDQIGNRAQGERLASLAKTNALSLARAALFLGPQIPMIFMGDEWGSTTPFQFFVNFEHDPSLEDAVRSGRIREFERFRSFSGEVPDPTAIETFQRSKLDWNDITKPGHAAILRETRDLIAVRAQHVIPLLTSGFIESSFKRLSSSGLEVLWRFHAGTLLFAANVGDGVVECSAPEGDVIWRSADLGDPPRSLKAWTGFFSRSLA